VFAIEYSIDIDEAATQAGALKPKPAKVTA
jgi:hypothetical protein